MASFNTDLETAIGRVLRERGFGPFRTNDLRKVRESYQASPGWKYSGVGDGMVIPDDKKNLLVSIARSLRINTVDEPLALPKRIERKLNKVVQRLQNVLAEGNLKLYCETSCDRIKIIAIPENTASVVPTQSLRRNEQILSPSEAHHVNIDVYPILSTQVITNRRKR